MLSNTNTEHPEMAEKATIMGCSSLAMVLILFSMEHQVSQTKIKTFLKRFVEINLENHG